MIDAVIRMMNIGIGKRVTTKRRGGFLGDLFDLIELANQRNYLCLRSTLTLTPSLDSATSTAKFTRKENCAAKRPYLNPVVAGINVARAITTAGGQATALLPSGGSNRRTSGGTVATGRIVDALPTHDWTRQNLHVVSEATGEQFRFVMPGAALYDNEWQQLLAKIAQLPADSLLILKWQSAAEYDHASRHRIAAMCQRSFCVVWSTVLARH